MSVIEWLLDSDPSIRWQVMRDLSGEPAGDVAAERAKVATEDGGAAARPPGRGRSVGPGCASRRRERRLGEGLPDVATRRLLLDLHGISFDDIGGFLDIDTATLSAWDEGEPAPGDERVGRYRSALVWMRDAVGTLKPEWTSTTWTLSLLRYMGLDPASGEARRAVAPVRDEVKWENDGQDYFDGEVEPCINGKAVALGAYFGENVDGIVERLLGEQLDDGGWNCEAERGSTRSSFHTTISVLEGFLEYERANGAPPAVTAARQRGEEYLLERRCSTASRRGRCINPAWTRFSFPTGWRYDVPARPRLPAERRRRARREVLGSDRPGGEQA